MKRTEKKRVGNDDILKTIYDNVSRETIYKPEELETMLEELNMSQYLIKSKGIELYNVPASFDIETYSFYEGKEKRAIMYIWQFSIGGLCMVGRVWSDFEDTMQRLVDLLGLHEKRQLFIYVHNLAYEFQFIRKRFSWSKVFAIEERKPVYAITDGGLAFHCSYLLSGYSLASVAKNLNYKIEKLDTLDYRTSRNSLTPISDKELAYCLNDIKIVVLYVAELMQGEYNLNSIPITKTGFVRRFCRDSCMKDFETKSNFKRIRYQELMRQMPLTVEVYQMLKRAFQGGFVHASAWYSGKIISKAKSKDETSAYPYAIVIHQFPCSAPERIEIHSREEFMKNLTLYCCCFDVCFEGLEATTTFENYISVSRCWVKEGVSENNGRVVSASRIWTTITEQDFFIIKKMYSWRNIKIANFIRFKRDYLPRDFVKAVLILYADKTTLNGVEGSEREYQQKKEMLNSCYGMSVTDPVRDMIEYGEDWKTELPDVVEALEKYNNDKNRFLYYAWGVWVTAYARARLMNAILEVAEDYLYSDTDSVKYKNPERHEAYFQNENRITLERLSQACKFHHFNEKLVRPKTVKGVEKPLGVWDDDGDYKYFKALRSKCYITVTEDDEIHLTTAGLNKRVTVPWLRETYGSNENILRNFNDGLLVPAEATGKNTHTYIDHEAGGRVADYLGNVAPYHELSYIHLEAGSYELSLTEEYKNFILTFAEESAN